MDIRINCLEQKQWSRYARHIEMEIMTPWTVRTVVAVVFFFLKKSRNLRNGTNGFATRHQISDTLRQDDGFSVG